MLAEAGYAVVLRQPARVVRATGARTGSRSSGAFGTVDTDDVLALLGAALEDPALDGERVGVMGGSYGGYLTAWLTTRTDRFVAAIVERGFLDPVSFVGSSDIGWFFGLEYLGDAGDEAGAAALAAQSPMAHVGRVRTPDAGHPLGAGLAVPGRAGAALVRRAEAARGARGAAAVPGRGPRAHAVGQPEAPRGRGSSTCCAGGRRTCPSRAESAVARPHAPQVDPGVDGVRLDRGELVVRQRRQGDGGEVLVELRGGARARPARTSRAGPAAPRRARAGAASDRRPGRSRRARARGRGPRR